MVASLGTVLNLFSILMQGDLCELFSVPLAGMPWSENVCFEKVLVSASVRATNPLLLTLVNYIIMKLTQYGHIRLCMSPNSESVFYFNAICSSWQD